MCHKFWILLAKTSSIFLQRESNTLNLPSSLIKYIGNVITLSFHYSIFQFCKDYNQIYLAMIPIYQFINNFVFLHLSKLLSKMIFFIINNTFRLSLISLVEFVLPRCCFTCNFITKNYNFCNKQQKFFQDHSIKKTF